MKKLSILCISVLLFVSLVACKEEVDNITENNMTENNITSDGITEFITTEQSVISTEDSTGYPHGNVQIRVVMINDKLYEDVNNHFEEIPDHFTNEHIIEAVDDYSFPVENQTGANVKVGDVFYSSDKVDLCVYYYDGEKYTQFKEMK